MQGHLVSTRMPARTAPFQVNRSCSRRASRICVQCSASSTSLTRRHVMEGLALVAGGMTVGASPALAGKPTAVGAYLPPAGIDDFVLFVPDSQKTPAIRAGTVDVKKPYRFALPPTWREARVANIQSGNYCQPRCAEPWTEVIFEDEAEGKAQVIVSPLVRLTNRPEAAIDELGTTDSILARLGSFITGTYLDEEDVVKQEARVLDDNRMYYFYEARADYGTVGPNTLTACTTKGPLAFLFVVSATDKQWAKNQSKLRKVVESFRA